MRCCLKGGYRHQVASTGSFTAEDMVFHLKFPVEGVIALNTVCLKEVESGWVSKQGDFKDVVWDTSTLKKIQSIILCCFVAGAIQGRIKGKFPLFT